MPVMDTPRLDWAPHWRTMNANLAGLAGLIPEERFEWAPAPGEWSAQLILAHIVLARYHGPIMQPADMARIGTVPPACKTIPGAQEELRASFAMVERFIGDQSKLDATYDNTGTEFYASEPARYDGHYIAYHRFAHDLHHRSTLIGFFNQWGVSLDGNWIRPL